MDHKDPPLSNEVFSPRTYWKLYYTLRNRILLAMKYNRGPGRGMAFCRLTGEMLWQTGYSMVRSKLGKSRFLRMKMVWKAYIDGMLGRKGKTADPVEFAKKVKKYEE